MTDRVGLGNLPQTITRFDDIALLVATPGSVLDSHFALLGAEGVLIKTFAGDWDQ